MTNNTPEKFPSNLLSDIDHAVGWAERSDVLCRLAGAHPLLPINSTTAWQYLVRAVGYYVQAGGDLSTMWSLDDMALPDALDKILKAALLHSLGTAHCMAYVVMTVARDWVQVDPEQMAALQKIASRLPTASFQGRRSRSSMMLSRGNSDPVVGSPLGLKKSA